MEQETACLVLNVFDITTNINAETYYIAGVSQTIDNQYGTIANKR